MPTTQKGLNGPALSHAQMDENFTLVDTNENAIAALEARATANEAVITANAAQEIVGEITFGENNANDAFVPFVITDTITGTLQDFVTPNQDLNGDWERVIYSNTLDRYTSGGKLILTLINNTGATSHYLTNEYVFSRVEGGDYNISTPTTIGDATLLDSIKITEVTVGSDTNLEVTLTASNDAPADVEFTRVIGQITYTSVPIFVTVSGY